MTLSDYIEKIFGIELLDCQKNTINELEKNAKKSKDLSYLSSEIRKNLF